MKTILIFFSATFCLAASVKAQLESAPLNNDMAALNKSENLTKKEIKDRSKTSSILSANDVSFQSRESFISDFGEIPNVGWHRGLIFDEATFMKKGEMYTAFYDYDAQLVGLMSDKTYEDLPDAAQNFIQKKYSGYAVKAVKFFDDNEQNETDMSLYGKQFEDDDNYFVELRKDNKDIVLQVDMEGDVYFFKALD